MIGHSRDAMVALMLNDWPGNVRELENAIEQAFILCRDDLIRVEDLPEHLHLVGNAIAVSNGMTLQDIEKAVIL